MAKRAAPDVFKRGETVKTLDPLPGVPQGEKGRLYLVNGLVPPSQWRVGVAKG